MRLSMNRMRRQARPFAPQEEGSTIIAQILPDAQVS
jgi:hypothetical protein